MSMSLSEEEASCPASSRMFPAQKQGWLRGGKGETHHLCQSRGGSCRQGQEAKSVPRGGQAPAGQARERDQLQDQAFVRGSSCPLTALTLLDVVVTEDHWRGGGLQQLPAVQGRDTSAGAGPAGPHPPATGTTAATATCADRAMDTAGIQSARNLAGTLPRGRRDPSESHPPGPAQGP